MLSTSKSNYMASRLSEAFVCSQQSYEYVQEHNPNDERSAHAVCFLKNDVQCYKIIKDELTKYKVQIEID